MSGNYLEHTDTVTHKWILIRVGVMKKQLEKPFIRLYKATHLCMHPYSQTLRKFTGKIVNFLLYLFHKLYMLQIAT